LARGSFVELVDSLSQRELVRQYAATFRAYVDRALLAGRVLLLIDGLDEISDPGDRAAFVCTLRTALQAYPRIAIVVTSREAGYRHVAAHLAPLCTSATISPFNDDDVKNLSVAWHREVVGQTEKVRADAEQLADTISRNDRIKRLASNPLLLTTLLLVKRWVGSLPTRRAVLYGKAVEVLLMTWNTEGHDPIPQEEALPQLCYVAAAMMFDGVQKISRPRLGKLLQSARADLPSELGYVKGTVDEFIHRIEDRSSLLMMTGHDVEDGSLVEYFEFRHLTFQEFLTAKAVVEGWHPRRKEEDTLASVLEPYFEIEAWREVIPLAAVLGGKATEALIQSLTQRALPLDAAVLDVLANCLADEASARPDTIRAANAALIDSSFNLQGDPWTPVLMRGKYGADFRAQAGQMFMSSTESWGEASEALGLAVLWQTLNSEDREGVARTISELLLMLKSSVALTRCEGASGLEQLCETGLLERERAEEAETQGAWHSLLMMLDGTPPERLSSLWALKGLVGAEPLGSRRVIEYIAKLLRLWRDSTIEIFRRFAASNIAQAPLADRDQWPSNVSFNVEEFDRLRTDSEPAAIILAWYTHLFADGEIAERIREAAGHAIHDLRTVERLYEMVTRSSLH
jgi:hypothetical protein